MPAIEATPLAQEDVRKVALLIPLGGAQAATGRDLLNAAQMALFDIAGDDFVLVPHDTGTTAQSAAAAARAALDDGAELILGPLLSASVSAVAPVARRANVPVIAFSNNRAVAGDGVFVMGFLPRDQITRVVDYARREGLTRLAAIAPENSYGRATVAALESAADAAFATVSEVTYYEPASAELPDIIRRFADYDQRRQALQTQRQALEGRDDAISKQALARLEGQETLGDVDFDAVLLPAGGNEVLQLAPLLAFYDIDPGRVKLLGTWLWDDVSLGTEPAMVGGWFAAPSPNARADFVDRFKAAYGHQPDRLATLAYDSVALAAILSRENGATDEEAFSLEALTTPNGFVGMDGIFRLLASGEVQRGLAVLEIRRGGFRELEPAPATFENFFN
ncbi:MAG: penicillin-binding protein activator [Alphaproteobacteria bacterium]